MSSPGTNDVAEVRWVGDGVPPACEEGGDPYRFALFATLRAEWRKARKAQGLPAGNRALAAELGLPRREVAMTQWATGGGDKAPAPWWVLMRLCHLLGFAILLAPDKAKIVRYNAPP